MKIKNTTSFPDYFLRRLISWCCREVGLPQRRLKKAVFRNARQSHRKIAFSGLGGGQKIIVRIGPPETFPTKEFWRQGVTHVAFADQIEALIGVTAHECYHCWQSFAKTLRGYGHDEPAAMAAERKAVEAFSAQREKLLSIWNAAPVAADKPPQPNIIEKRAARIEMDLARWQRKLKLAQTKVKKLKAKAAYYGARLGTASTKQERS